MKTISLLALSALLLAGCGTLRPIGDDPASPLQIAKNAKAIHDTAREGTFIAIKKIYDDDKLERVKAAAELKERLDATILPVLNDPGAEVTAVLERELMSAVPEEYHGLMAVAYETLHNHYEFPTTAELLPEPYLTYLRAFLTGVREGAAKVLASDGVVESRGLFIPEDA